MRQTALDARGQHTLADVPGLSAEDLNLIAESIVRFGEGEHPVPDRASIGFFRAGYALRCVDRAAESDGDPTGTALRGLANRLREAAIG